MEQEKQRIIQEFVPGKQVTLAHVIANPDSSLYKKLGVIGDYTGALGIMTITPSEGAIIGADVAMKAANVEVVFVDRFNGSLIINGTVADVEAAVKDVLNVLENTLHFAPTVITRKRTDLCWRPAQKQPDPSLWLLPSATADNRDSQDIPPAYQWSCYRPPAPVSFCI